MTKKIEYLLLFVSAVLLLIFFVIMQKNSIEVGSSWAGLAIGLSFGMLINQKIGFIKRRKLDEREYQLYHRANSITFALTLAMTAILRILTTDFDNTTFFQQNWFKLFLIFVLMINGIVGFIIFRNK